MYQILFDSKRVRKELKRLPKKERERILQAIQNDLVDFGHHTQGIRFIKLRGQYRLKQGNYRILFTVEGQTIRIEKIKDRKDVYR
jgi:mRNA-degrading endonuclease RelE of RelBE toxin-antitoxin system